MKPCHALNMFLTFWHLRSYVLIWFALIKRCNVGNLWNSYWKFGNKWICYWKCLTSIRICLTSIYTRIVKKLGE